LTYERGGSGFWVKRLKENEEAGRRYWGGMKDGGCMLHQLGNPVIICYLFWMTLMR